MFMKASYYELERRRFTKEKDVLFYNKRYLLICNFSNIIINNFNVKGGFFI